MKRLFIISFLILVFIAEATNPALAGTRRKKYIPFLTRGDTSVTVSMGFRNNNLDWNTASDITGTQTPNIISELTWEDIQLFEGTANVRHMQPVNIPYLHGSVHLEGEFKAGTVMSGENQDSDFLGDDRTLEFSRSNNASDEGYAIGGFAAIGYRLDITPEKVRQMSPQSYLSVTPLVGYGYDRQVYTMTDGYQTINLIGGWTGPFGGLDSEYQADWFGPFYGVETEWQKERHMVRLRGEYHTLDFEGEGIWNLRPERRQDPSFTHVGDGDGYRVNGEYAYAINESYVFTVNGIYEQRTMEDGVRTLFLRDGSTPPLQKVNEVNDISKELRFGVRYHW
jgi:hypothetical protein